MEGGKMKTYRRLRQPAHHIFKIERFSELVNSRKEAYKGSPFEAGGYQWRMVVYPNVVDKGSEASGHVSVDKLLNQSGHVTVGVILDKEANKNKLSRGWQIDADIKVLVYNWKDSDYRVTEMTSDEKYNKVDYNPNEFIADALFDLKDFKDESKGFIKNDNCAFGAEIIVMTTDPNVETLSMVKDPNGGSFSWTIPKFRQYMYETLTGYSDTFNVEGRKWKLQIYPTGSGSEKGNFLSLCLYLEDARSLLADRLVYAEFILRIVNQYGKGNEERKDKHWFSSSHPNHGYPQMMPLSKLGGKNHGFVVGDNTSTAEVDIHQISISSSDHDTETPLSSDTKPLSTLDPDTQTSFTLDHDAKPLSRLDCDTITSSMLDPDTKPPSRLDPNTKTLFTLDLDTKPPSSLDPDTKPPSTLHQDTKFHSTLNLDTKTPSTLDSNIKPPSRLDPNTITTSTSNPDTKPPFKLDPYTKPSSKLDPDTKTPSMLDPDTKTTSTLDPDTKTTSTLELDTKPPSKLDLDIKTPSISDLDTKPPSTLDLDTKTTYTLNPDTKTTSTLDIDTKHPSPLDPDTKTSSMLDLDTKTPSTFDPDTKSLSKLDPDSTKPPSRVDRNTKTQSTLKSGD